MDLLAAAGQRLLLQAVAPAAEGAEPAPSGAAAPATAVDAGNTSTGYQVMHLRLLVAWRLANAPRCLLPRHGRPDGGLPTGAA